MHEKYNSMYINKKKPISIFLLQILPKLNYRKIQQYYDYKNDQ